MKKKKMPEIINLSETELDGLTSRVAAGLPLLDGDDKILLSVLSTYKWLQHQLQSTRLTINRLKKVFGFSTEKRWPLKKHTPPEELGASLENGELTPNTTISNKDELPPKK